MLPRQGFRASILLALLDIGIAAPVDSPTPEGRWMNLTQLSRPRQEHVTVAINDTTLAVVGGAFPVLNGSVQIGYETTDSIELYDIPTDTWRNASRAPYAVNHPNVASVNGRVYLLGGLVDAHRLEDSPVDWEASGECHVYDPAEDAWSELEAMPIGTERGSAILGVHGDVIYVAGGMTTLDPEYQDTVSTVTAFNTTSEQWQRLPGNAANLPVGRQHAVGAVVEDSFYVIAGRWFDMHNVRGTVYALDLNDVEANWTTSQAQMPTPRGGLSGAVVDGNFFTFGGEANEDSSTGIFEECEVMDIQTQAWSELSSMAVPRHGTSAVAVGNRIYIPGGGLQQDGFPVEIDGVEHLLRTTNHFDVYVVGGND